MQKRISIIASRLANAGIEVVIVCNEGENVEGNPRTIRVSSLVEGFRLIRNIVSPSRKAVLYVARLIFPEHEHAELIESLSSENLLIVLRAQSTRAAELLSNDNIAKILAPRVSVVHVLNQESVSLLEGVYSNDQLKLLPNPFPLQLRGTWPRDNYAIFAGRIVPSKNLHSLLIAWTKLQPEHLRLRVYGVVYDESYYDYCRMISVGTKSIEWCAPYAPNDLSAIARARFLVIPSFREGHSNLVTEAMSVGTFVLGSKIPGIAEHLRNGRGLCIPPTTAGLEDGLRSVVAMGDDELMHYTDLARAYALRHTNDLQVISLLGMLD